MKKQGDDPYYDLISLDEWSAGNEKRTILLSHHAHMASGLSIRGLYDHFYEDSKKKESELEKYYKHIGLKLLPIQNRMCDYAKQFCKVKYNTNDKVVKKNN